MIRLVKLSQHMVWLTKEKGSYSTEPSLETSNQYLITNSQRRIFNGKR